MTEPGLIHKFFKDIGWLTGVNVLTQLAALITFPIYAQYLRVEDFGLLDYLLLLGVLGGIVCSVESHQAVIRLIPTRSTDAERQNFVSSVVWFNGCVCGLVVACVSGWAITTEGRIFGVQTTPLLIGFAALAWWMTQLKQQVVAVYRALLDTHTIAWVTFIAFFVQISFGLTAVALLGMGVLGVFVALFSSNAVALALLVWKRRELFRPVICRQALGEVFRFSAPLVVSSLGAIGWVYTDRYIAKHFLGLHEVGLLGVGYRFAGVVGLLTNSIAMALGPLIYTYNENRETPRDIARLFHYFVGFGAVAVAGFTGYSSLVLDFLAPAEYLPSAPLFPIIAGALLLGASAQFFPGLILTRNTKMYAAIQVSGLVVNITISALVVQRWGVIGVSIASFVTAGCVFAAIVLAGHRHYRIPVAWTKVAGAGMFTIGIVLLIYAYSETVPLVRWLGYAAPLCAAVFVYFTGLIPRHR